MTTNDCPKCKELTERLDNLDQLLKTYEAEFNLIAKEEGIKHSKEQELYTALIKVQAERNAVVTFTMDLLKGLYEKRSKDNSDSQEKA